MSGSYGKEGVDGFAGCGKERGNTVDGELCNDAGEFSQWIVFWASRGPIFRGGAVGQGSGGGVFEKERGASTGSGEVVEAESGVRPEGVTFAQSVGGE